MRHADRRRRRGVALVMALAVTGCGSAPQSTTGTSLTASTSSTVSSMASAAPAEPLRTAASSSATMRPPVTSTVSTTGAPSATRSTTDAGPTDARPTDARATTTEASPLPPAPFTFPVPVDTTGHTQVITVAAESSSSTTGTLTAWQQDDAGGWSPVAGPIAAYLGRNGIGETREGRSVTPAGQFSLTEAFGVEPAPSVRLPYFQAGRDDWWVSDVDSALYNTHQVCAETDCAFDTAASEQLETIVPQYRYAVVIDYNRFPTVPGDGSAFFLHVEAGAPTAGCVSIDETALLTILGWLDPARSPVIAMGVGQA